MGLRDYIVAGALLVGSVDGCGYQGSKPIRTYGIKDCTIEVTRDHYIALDDRFTVKVDCPDYQISLRTPKEEFLKYSTLILEGKNIPIEGLVKKKE